MNEIMKEKKQIIKGTLLSLISTIILLVIFYISDNVNIDFVVISISALYFIAMSIIFSKKIIKKERQLGS